MSWATRKRLLKAVRQIHRQRRRVFYWLDQEVAVGRQDWCEGCH